MSTMLSKVSVGSDQPAPAPAHPAFPIVLLLLLLLLKVSETRASVILLCC